METVVPYTNSAMHESAGLWPQMLTFPMPAWPSVAGFEDEAAAEPWYISDFFFTPGVARVVPFDSF